MRASAVLGVVLLTAGIDAGAQTRKPVPRRPAAPAPAPPITIAPAVECPSPLGEGVRSQTVYCDVPAGRDPAGGILISLPPHRGPVTLTFDLHNRHTYSDEQVKANRAFTRYTAVIGALTIDNTLISRAAIQTEFRKASDLVERIGGGAGPAGVKAVAPTGTERVTVTIPEEEEKVSLLGEKLLVERLDAPAVTYTTPGRPIALVSNILIEYRPAPEPKPTAKPPATKPGAARQPAR